MIIPNKKSDETIQDHQISFLLAYGAIKKGEMWFIPPFPNIKEFYTKTSNLYMAYTIALDGVKLLKKNQG